MEAGTEAGAPGAGAGRARPPRQRPARTRAQPLSGCPPGLPAPATTPRSPHGAPGAAGPGGRQRQRFLATRGPGFALRAALPPLGPQPPARPRLRLPIRGRFLRLRTAPAESVLKRQRAPPGSSSPCARGATFPPPPPSRGLAAPHPPSPVARRVLPRPHKRNASGLQVPRGSCPPQAPNDLFRSEINSCLGRLEVPSPRREQPAMSERSPSRIQPTGRLRVSARAGAEPRARSGSSQRRPHRGAAAPPSPASSPGTRARLSDSSLRSNGPPDAAS
nr:proline-rich protein 2-like [Odocoileus virginianus texanus]